MRTLIIMWSTWALLTAAIVWAHGASVSEAHAERSELSSRCAALERRIIVLERTTDGGQLRAAMTPAGE